jgi:hypothetical protein
MFLLDVVSPPTVNIPTADISDPRSIGAAIAVVAIIVLAVILFKKK